MSYGDWTNHSKVLSKAFKQHADFQQKLPGICLFDQPPEPNSYRTPVTNFFEHLSKIDDERPECNRRNGLYSEFPYIRYHLDEFHNHMKAAITPKTRSFIDVGCGGGDKLEFMKQTYPKLKVYGVEHDPKLAAWAGTVADQVWCMDALKMNYKPFDLIYAYWPIAERKLMEQLVKLILDTKKKSARFVLVGFQPQERTLLTKIFNLR